MTGLSLPDPIFIDDAGSLNHLTKTLSDEPTIAVDTESNSLYVYQEQVCLIQLSTQDVDYLVDPLALTDLSPLAPIFKSPNIEKIFHAAEYDVICLKRDFGFDFNNLFDTMVASRILGRDKVGLGSIMQEEFNIHINKRYQRANWGKRPLPSDMQTYAQADTHFLIAIRNKLDKDLQERNLWMLAEEDFERLKYKKNEPGKGSRKGIWKISGAYDLSPRQAAVLQKLHQYRDRIARSKNLPLFKIIHDKSLLAIATECPTTNKKITRLQGTNRGQVRKHRDALLTAVKSGLESDPIYPPPKPKADRDYINRVDTLRAWRKAAGKERGVMSDVILPRSHLNIIAKNNPRSPSELADILIDVPWRMEHFGEQILKTLSQC